MSRILLVGNLAVETKETELKEFLASYCSVKTLTIPKNNSGRMIGFALVETSSRKEAIQAQAELINSKFCGRTLTVTLKELEPPKKSPFDWLKRFWQPG